jgi:colanic acid biosynthesis glycosyl transferase WcaI
LRILFLTENFPPEVNAAASRVFERACHWIGWGHEVMVLTTAPNFPEGKLYPGYRNRWYQAETLNGIRVIRVKSFITSNRGTVLRILDFLSFMVMAFAVGIFLRRPQIVVATSPQFFTAVAGWMLAKVRRVPFIFELGDLWPATIVAVGAIRSGFMLRMLEKIELFLYRQAAAIVALSSSFKDDLVRRKIEPSKIRVVINGVDLHRYQPQPRDRALARMLGIDGQFVVGYIGTHGLSHGLENVLEAASLLMSKDSRIRFLFVGAGAQRDELIGEAKRRALTNVTFVPAQPKSAMPSIWSLCDVALVHLKGSAVFETVIPSKIFEAMGMALPLLLVAPPGEASRILKMENAGLWVQADDPVQLVEAVCELAGNEDDRQKYAQNSHRAAPRYSRERQARDFMAVLEEVLALSACDVHNKGNSR